MQKKEKFENKKSRVEKKNLKGHDPEMRERNRPMQAPLRKRHRVNWIDADPNKETPIKVIPIKKGSYAEEGYCICAVCNNVVEERDNYCRHCGQKLETGKNISKNPKSLHLKRENQKESVEISVPTIKVPDDIPTTANNNYVDKEEALLNSSNKANDFIAEQVDKSSQAPVKKTASRYVSGFKTDTSETNTQQRGAL